MFVYKSRNQSNIDYYCEFVISLRILSRVNWDKDGVKNGKG